jgi:predicted  nucleic acid-binding Zn-ribbon protein
MKRLSNEEFIEKINLIHPGKYQYPEKYINSRQKIKIICPTHGSFFQLVSDHLGGHGCKDCAHNRPLDTNKFVELSINIHRNRYNYDFVSYKNSSTYVKIKCSIHGIFLQKPNSHLQGEGCPKCGNQLISELKTSNIDEFILKANAIHNNKYSYTNSIYIDSYTKIEIICSQHGKFWQKPNAHMQNAGCPKCAGRISKKELAWLDFVGVPDDKQHRQVKLPFHSGRKYKVDGYDPSTNTVYEFWGDYFHGNPRTRGKDPEAMNKKLKKTFGQLYEETLQKIRDIEVSGYKLIYIWEDEFCN